ncbi:thialysine N-epsilon-acetyltransferase-like [Pogona vitticeps]
MGFVVRPCAVKDLKDIMRLVEEIAVIYNVPVNKVATSVEVLKKHGFGEKPRFECFVAEVPPEQKSKEGHTLIGYVLSAYTYNTWRGKNLYMDNLYVMPEFRGRRIGKTLASTAAMAAWQKGCTQLRMHASADKPENIEFLKRQGGENLTETEDWNILRFYNPVLRGMAAQSKF